MKVDSTPPVVGLPVIPRSSSDAAANRELIKAVASINRSRLLGEDRELTFMIGRESSRPVVKVVDRVSRQLISQIPAAQALRMSEHLRLR